jgi:predicted nucleotidyltransferase
MSRTIADFSREKREIAERMIASIVERIDPARVILFGSVARSRARETSDIDLIIVGESDLSFKERMNVLYGELDRSADVDMLWYTPRELDRMQRTSSFVRHALEEGVVMYERSEPE